MSYEGNNVTMTIDGKPINYSAFRCQWYPYVERFTYRQTKSKMGKRWVKVWL